MCLTRLTPPPAKKPRIGYKQFERRYDGTLEGWFRSDRYQLGQRYDADMIGGRTRTHIETDAHEPYRLGFHVFLTLEDAKKYAFGSHCCIVEVAVAELRASGEEDTGREDIPELIPCCTFGKMRLRKVVWESK